MQGAAQFASQMVGRMLVHRDKPDVAKFVDDITASAAAPVVQARCILAPTRQAARCCGRWKATLMLSRAWR